MNQKTFLITGCSSGLGRALAEAALAAGHQVTATARDIRRIIDLEKDPRCQIAALDVTDGANIRTVVADCARHWDKLDVLVNNAGYGLIGAVEECDDDQIQRSLQTHFIGPVQLIREVLPIMRKHRTGHIINISAAASISNYAGFGIYGGAKAALDLASQSLRTELAPLGIRVTIVQPGPFRTDFIARGLEAASTQINDYEGTAGRFRKMIESLDGKQTGDPHKAAQAILSIIDSNEPPFRITLGKYANEKLRRSLIEQEAQRASWEQLGLSTDFGADKP